MGGTKILSKTILWLIKRFLIPYLTDEWSLKPIAAQQGLIQGVKSRDVWYMALISYLKRRLGYLPQKLVLDLSRGCHTSWKLPQTTCTFWTHRWTGKVLVCRRLMTKSPKIYRTGESSTAAGRKLGSGLKSHETNSRTGDFSSETN